MLDLKNIVEKVRPAVLDAGAFIRGEREKFSQERVEFKGSKDLVSYVDKTSEEQLVKALREVLPEAGFITEEGTVQQNGKVYNWVIDPLDGTTNFVHGVPPFSVSVALQENGVSVAGLVYEVNMNELFYAWQGGGAFLNGEPIRVSATEELNHALLVTGFPYDPQGRLGDWMKVFEQFITRTRGVRRLGSAAVDLAYVGCGRLDGFYEYNLNNWDIAAGILIVREAGGIVSDFSGEQDFINKRELVASTPALGRPMLDVIIRNFK